MKHREVVTCPGHPVSWLGLRSPPVDLSRVQDEIRSVSFIHLFLASLLPFLVPLHSSGWCSHFLKALGPPTLPVGSWYYRGQLRKEQEMEAGSPGCRCEGCKSRPREGSAWMLPISDSLAFVVGHLPGQSRQSGKALGASEPSFPLAWGTSQHFSVSHILN